MLASARQRVVQVLRLARWTPFDTSTPEGRSQERYRRAAVSAVASMAAKVIGLTTVFISMPLTESYLGKERFGVYTTVASLVAMLRFADLGIGNGLVNELSSADGRGDREQARRLLASGLAMLATSGACLLLFALVVGPLLPWPTLLNTRGELASSEATGAVVAFIATFALNVVVGAFPRVSAAYQESYYASLWQAGGSFLALVGIIIATQVGAGLPALVVLISGSNVLAAAMNGVTLLARQRPWLRPRRADVSVATARTLMKTGGLFFLLQITGAVGHQADRLIIAHLDPRAQAAVADYAYPAQLFFVSPILLGFAISPLWPAYSEAIARGDGNWLARTVRRSLALGLAATLIPSLVLIVVGPAFIQLWTQGRVHTTVPLLIALGAWAVVNGLAGPLSMFLTGIGALRFQVIAGVAMAAASVGLSVALAGVAGATGVVWGKVLAALVCSVVPALIFAYRYTRRLDLADRTSPAP